MKLMGMLICVLTRKHMRGKRVGQVPSVMAGKVVRDFQCPRCGGVWSREVKAKQE